MFYRDFDREDLGDVRVYAVKTMNGVDVFYDAIDICTKVGVENVISFIMSVDYSKYGKLHTSSEHRVEGYILYSAMVNKIALQDLFFALKKEGYAPITLDRLVDWVNNEVIPCAEQEAQKLDFSKESVELWQSW